MTADQTLDFMCTPGVAHDPASIQARYWEISTNQPPLFAIPRHDRVLSQLVWPLRHAKASYMTGNYLGTIALAGIVAEMTALLAYELMEDEPVPEGAIGLWTLTRADQRRLYGQPFAKLGQERKLGVLTAVGKLSPDVAAAFERIRLVRNRHLHLSQGFDEVAFAKDARSAFHDAVTVVAAVIGQDMKDGAIVMRPEMVRYLERTSDVIERENPPGPKDATS